MTFPRARLVVSACLFVGWLGYLLVLVLLSRQTIVLSRSQFLAAEVWVVAQVSDDQGMPSATVEIMEAIWPAGLQGGRAKVVNLPDAGPQGYIGPGRYILPLRPMKEQGVYSVALVPSSPGYIPQFVDITVHGGHAEPERNARIAREDLGVDEQRIRDFFKGAHPLIAVELKRTVPWEQAVAFRKHLRQSKEGAGEERPNAPEVTLTPNDVRIYPLTPDTKEQLEELIAARAGHRP